MRRRFIPAYGITAVLILFIVILGKEKQGQDVSAELADIKAARDFYQSGSELQETARGPAPIIAARKACRIIDQLLASRKDHSASGANPARTAAALFKDVAASVPSRPGSPPPQIVLAGTGLAAPSNLNGRSESVAALHSTFPTLALFGENGCANAGYTGDFDLEASRHALMSLSQVESNPFGTGPLDLSFTDFFENYGTPT